MPMNNKVVYISGAITSDPNYKAKFDQAEARILIAGAKCCINPATVIPEDWEYDRQMDECLRLVNDCDVIAMLPCWVNSPGAKVERAHAENICKTVVEL